MIKRNVPSLDSQAHKIRKMAYFNSRLFLLVIPFLALTFYLPALSNAFSDFLTPITIAKLFSVFIHFPASDTNNTAGLIETGQDSVEPAISGSRITIEIGDSYTRIINDENRTIKAEKLKEKPGAVKDPRFTSLVYLEIHGDSLTDSGAVIRILNEWGRSDLIIYHYKNDEWYPLQTTINGSYIEAVTGSFSVYALRRA